LKEIKMKITLSPIRSDATLTLHRKGCVLTVNGEAFDFSGLPEGATLPRSAVSCDWLASDVERVAGILQLTLLLPHGPIPDPAPKAARAVTNPEPIIVTKNGRIALPEFTPEEARA